MALLELGGLLLDLFYEEEERVERHRRRRLVQLRRRSLRDLSNPFDIDLEDFRKLYRLTQDVTISLIEMLEEHLLRNRRSAVPAHLKVLLTLRFLGEGSFQRGVGQDYLHPVSQPTASKIINTVINAILEHRDKFVRFPQTAEERQVLSTEFQQFIAIPGVIGIVDCFTVSMIRPSENEEAFFNYKAGHSLNVQIIVDSKYEILNIRACPGSNNDRYIWKYSQSRQYLEFLRSDNNIVNDEGKFYILGDSGYTSSRVLLTPILNAVEGTPEFNYSDQLTHIRYRVEQTIGILTGVWKAIKRARKLYYEPEKVVKIINACGILHNFKRRHGIPLQYDNGPYMPANFNDYRDQPAGTIERNRLIEEYFN